MRVLVQKVEVVGGETLPGGHTLGKVTNKHKIIFFKKIHSFIFGTAWSLLPHVGLPLVAGSKGYSLAVVLLIAVASLVAKHGL